MKNLVIVSFPAKPDCLEDLKNSMMKNNKTVDENLVASIAKIGEKIIINTHAISLCKIFGIKISI